MAGDPSSEVASQVPFYDLCSLLEKIADTPGTEKKKKILTTFVSSWREAHGKLHGTSKTVSVYLFLCVWIFRLLRAASYRKLIFPKGLDSGRPEDHDVKVRSVYPQLGHEPWS